MTLQEEYDDLIKVRDSLSSRLVEISAEVRQLDLLKEELRYEQYKIDDQFTFVVSRLAVIRESEAIDK